MTIWCKHVHKLEPQIPVFPILDMHAEIRNVGFISRLTGKCATQFFFENLQF